MNTYQDAISELEALLVEAKAGLPLDEVAQHTLQRAIDTFSQTLSILPRLTDEQISAIDKNTLVRLKKFENTPAESHGVTLINEGKKLVRLTDDEIMEIECSLLARRKHFNGLQLGNAIMDAMIAKNSGAA